MRNKKFSGSISGKGYYIALVLCAAAIGISGFLYYRNADKTDKEQTAGTPTVNQSPDDQQVVATNPDGSLVTDPDAERPAPPKNTVYPVQGQTVAVYAMDSLTYNETTRDWRVHNGIDIAAASGTTVLAACNGQVLAVEEDALMGTTVILEHDGGYQATYANLQVSPPVAAGDFVSAGQIIGAVGTTAAAESAQASHLHFAVTKDGESIDPHTFLDE